METILIVEDDPSILFGLTKNLKYEGYEVITANDGDSGLQEALSGKADLILLDIMLPGVNGLEIARTLKRAEIEIPIIMISARNQEIDKIMGLDLGADDYITKPFKVRELLARIRAVMRRQRRHDQRIRDEKRDYGEFMVDFAARTVSRDGSILEFSPREFELLRFFLENPNRVLERSHILNRVWGYDYEGTARTIDNFVTKIRQKLEADPEAPRFFVTARGLGYKFIETPEPATSGAELEAEPDPEEADEPEAAKKVRGRTSRRAKAATPSKPTAKAKAKPARAKKSSRRLKTGTRK